jgi:hypothetical protein
MPARDKQAETSTMKVTTVRFGADLWALLEVEAARTGVSVAQYIREAALARAAFAAGARAEAPAELLHRWGTSMLDPDVGDAARATALQRLVYALTRSVSQAQQEDALALQHESRQTVRRTTEVLERSRSRRTRPD